MKLSFKDYSKESEYFTLVFDLLRHSLVELNGKGFRRFMEDSRKPKDTKLAKLIELFGTTPEDQENAEDFRRRHRRKMSVQFPVTPTLQWTEYKGHALLGLNASELIIRISLFEAFLKEIHRHVLAAKPQLLALNKPNRPIPLKDIFRGGLESFKMTEIDRQVREADRLPTNQRAKFFARHLKLPWGTDTEIAQVADLTELRHSLVHKSPGTPVTDSVMNNARKLLRSIPRRCFDQAAKHRDYASHFAK